MTKPFIIGISGGSGSGKTTFLKRLAEDFGDDQVCLLSQDNYYRPREQQLKDDNDIENFDLPESFEEELYARDVLKLIHGEDVYIKEYTYNNHLAEPKYIVYKPAPILIIEGIFVFHFPQIEKMMDFKIFIDAEVHIKLIRRIQRDQLERNYPLEDVLYRYQNHVFPAYQKYILPYKSHCDIVVNNNKSFENALNTVKLAVKEKLDLHEKRVAK